MLPRLATIAPYSTVKRTTLMQRSSIAFKGAGPLEKPEGVPQKPNTETPQAAPPEVVHYSAAQVKQGALSDLDKPLWGQISAWAQAALKATPCGLPVAVQKGSVSLTVVRVTGDDHTPVVRQALHEIMPKVSQLTPQTIRKQLLNCHIIAMPKIVTTKHQIHVYTRLHNESKALLAKGALLGHFATVPNTPCPMFAIRYMVPFDQKDLKDMLDPALARKVFATLYPQEIPVISPKGNSGITEKKRHPFLRWLGF